MPGAPGGWRGAPPRADCLSRPTRSRATRAASPCRAPAPPCATRRRRPAQRAAWAGRGCRRRWPATWSSRAGKSGAWTPLGSPRWRWPGNSSGTGEPGSSGSCWTQADSRGGSSWRGGWSGPRRWSIAAARAVPGPPATTGPCASAGRAGPSQRSASVAPPGLGRSGGPRSSGWNVGGPRTVTQFGQRYKQSIGNNISFGKDGKTHLNNSVSLTFVRYSLQLFEQLLMIVNSLGQYEKNLQGFEIWQSQVNYLPFLRTYIHTNWWKRLILTSKWQHQDEAP